jgi:serine/threonine protein kinase
MAFLSGRALQGLLLSQFTRGGAAVAGRELPRQWRGPFWRDPWLTPATLCVCVCRARTEEASGRQYALKRMRKSAVVQCPEHVFCEQAITRNTAHPFCIRQYASFQDKYHLYFLFDLMSGGDLMDVLVSEAKVIKRRIPQGALRRVCFAPKARASDAPLPARCQRLRAAARLARLRWTD